jgi:protein-disulfide isomerase
LEGKMASASKRNRGKQKGILFGFAGLLFALVIPMVGQIFLDRPVAASSETLQIQQRMVSEVMLSTERAVIIGDSPTRGNPDAELVLLKFSDFQCPFCGTAATDMKTFMNDHEEDVLYVYKHFPLSRIHPEAIPSAKAAWAAQQQGQFWPYHDALFEQQAQLGDELYLEIAQSLELDMEQFERDRTSEAAQAAIDQDMALVRALRLYATPTFVFNDLLLPAGTPLEFFEKIVEQAS